MDLKKLAPWNWIKKEEDQQPVTLPVLRSGELRHDHPILQLHKEIDRMFDTIFRGFGFPSTGFGRDLAPLAQSEWLRPTLDIAAGDKEYVVTVELPGVDEKDVQLELSEDALVVKGEKKQELEENKKNFYRMERSYGSFRRVLSLPEDAEQDSIAAAYKHGILTITIPRRAELKKESRSINIKRD